MNTRWFCLASLLLCLFSASESSRAQGNNSSSSFCIYPSVWFPKMKKSDLLLRDTVGSGLTLGQEIDLEKDFGVRDGPRTFPGVRVCLGYRGSFFLRGGYQELNFAGNSAAGGPLEIAGYTIQPGSRVDVSTRFDFFEVGLQYNLVNSEDFKLGILVEPKFLSLRTRIAGTGQEGSTGPFVPFREKEEELVPIPLLGLTVELRPFDFLGIRAEIKGLKLPDAEDFGLSIEGDVEAIDYEVAASLFLGDSVALTGGFRGLKFDVELEQSSRRRVELDLDFEGWFAALDIRF